MSFDVNWDYQSSSEPISYFPETTFTEYSVTHKLHMKELHRQCCQLLGINDESQDDKLLDNVVQNGTSQSADNIKRPELLRRNNWLSALPSDHLPKFSNLSTAEHSEYLHLLREYSGKVVAGASKRERQKIQRLATLHSKVVAEQEEYIKHLKHVSQVRKKDYLYIHPEAQRYVRELLAEKLQYYLSYPKYYAFDKNFRIYRPGTLVKHTPILRHITSLLEMGKLPRLVQPSSGIPCIMPLDYEKVCRRFQPPRGNLNMRLNIHPSKEPVSRDLIAKSLSEKHHADFIMSLSSLKALIDCQPNEGKSWELPIFVTECENTVGNNREVNLKQVFVDKPLPTSNMIVRQRNALYHKYAMKLKLTHVNLNKLKRSAALVEGTSISMDNSSIDKHDPSRVLPVLDENPFEDYGNDLWDKETFGTDVATNSSVNTTCNINQSNVNEDKRNGSPHDVEDHVKLHTENADITSNYNKDCTLNNTAIKGTNYTLQKTEIKEGLLLCNIKNENKHNEHNIQSNNADTSAVSEKQKSDQTIQDNSYVLHNSPAEHLSAVEDLNERHSVYFSSKKDNFEMETDNSLSRTKILDHMEMENKIKCKEGTVFYQNGKHSYGSSHEESDHDIDSTSPSKQKKYSKIRQRRKNAQMPCNINQRIYSEISEGGISQDLNNIKCTITRSKAKLLQASEIPRPTRRGRKPRGGSHRNTVGTNKGNESHMSKFASNDVTNFSECSEEEEGEDNLLASPSSKKHRNMRVIESSSESDDLPLDSLRTKLKGNIHEDIDHKKKVENFIPKTQKQDSSNSSFVEVKQTKKLNPGNVCKHSDDTLSEDNLIIDESCVESDKNENFKSADVCSVLNGKMEVSSIENISINSYGSKKECNINTENKSTRKEIVEKGKNMQKSYDAKYKGNTLDEILHLQEMMLTTKGINCTSNKLDSSATGAPTPLNSANLLENSCSVSEVQQKLNTSSSSSDHDATSFVNQGIEDPSQYPPPSPVDNIAYNLWNFEGWKLLLRSKIDCLKPPNNDPVFLFSKLEYQSQYGGEITTSSELLRQWTTLTFHPGSQAIKVRINALTSELVMMEEVSLPQLIALSGRFQPEHAAMQLGTILESLKKLPEGHYLLINKGTEETLTLHKETDSGKRGALNLHAVINQRLSALDNSSVTWNEQRSPPWLPVDPEVSLPAFTQRHRIPATFPPRYARRKPQEFPMHKKKKKIKKN